MVLSSDKHYLFLRKDSEKPAYNVKVLDEFSVVTYKSQETSEVFPIFKIWPSFNCFNLQGISRDSLFRDNMPQIVNLPLSKTAFGHLHLPLVLI
jgi:hypothetical protein